MQTRRVKKDKGGKGKVSKKKTRRQIEKQRKTRRCHPTKARPPASPNATSAY